MQLFAAPCGMVQLAISDNPTFKLDASELYRLGAK